MAITQIKGSNIEDGTVLAADIKDDSITNAKIKSDAAIAMTKLAVDPTDASNISSGTLPAGRYTDTVYTHPTTAGNKHIPTAGATDQVLTYSSSGTAAWADPAAGGTTSATDCESGTRDISIANSTQSFTAFGQQPDLVDIMFVVSGSVRGACWAKVNANGTDFGVHMNASNANSVAQQWSQTGTAYPIIISSGNWTSVQPYITSTGIDLVFTKTGSPTGTCNILITYMKFA